MKENYFMGADGFVWFTGVVEDRDDPEKLGRVRVRCLGWNSESLQDIPKSDLPWAHVMHSINNPSMQGLGNTPSFLVEGSWVIGFFLDAVEKQQPLIMGSLPGIPKDVADHTKGFNDPRSGQSTQDDYIGTPTYGPYPGDPESGHTISQPDTSMLARGEKSEDHSSLIKRRIAQQLEIPVATKPNIKTVSDTLKTDATRTTYNEPDAKSILPIDSPYTASQYPYNHVFESESGHVMEVDDTPDKERLLRYHKTGTFEEIHPDGQRVVKVVGKNYEIIADDNNVFINGDGETSRDFCYIDNVIQANLLAAVASQGSVKGQVYNVAVGERTSLNELYFHLRDRLAKRFKYLKETQPIYRDFRSGDVRHSLADIGKAQEFLGYTPSHRIVKGLDEALDWYVQLLSGKCL